MLKQIIIKKGKERAMNNRHPWIFSGAVAKMPHDVENGEIVEVRNQDGGLIGYGFYAPGNQIICRVFEYTRDEMPVTDKAYWHNKIASAFAMRQKFVINEQTNCYRLIHAEGDFFPGLIADVYDKTVAVQLLIKGTERIADFIVEGLEKLGFPYVYNKSKEVAHRLEDVSIKKGWISQKEGDVRIPVLENGVKFWVNVEEGQKTGFFLDQRDARDLVGHYSKDAKVLNTFSYSGGFSMYALKEGAELVHSVDVSQKAVDLCDENVALNGFAPEKHEGFADDVFNFLKNMETDYDVIILDPPAFAKNARAVPKAAQGYKQLNLQAFRRIKPGGIVFTFSCSQKIDRDLFRKIVFGAAADAHRNIRILHQTTQPNCHPINIYHPENEYLKGLVLYVE
ncbi:class I SAM-dependent rRNA methyltransferase [Limibacter armeniacum]|uniref:class I SAM-dependent rRNA methyltransferase n=1 Tax=Limibacter armeniacum TaxID=466084 RepID=UPI002FE55447